MWKLSGRDNKIRQWAELGEFQSVSNAARRVLELELDPLGALFFRVYVDPSGEKSDAEIRCRLEYQSDKSFYLLTRAVQWFFIRRRFATLEAAPGRSAAGGLAKINELHFDRASSEQRGATLAQYPATTALRSRR